MGKALTAAEAATAEATPAGATRLVVVGIDVDAQFVDVDPRGDSPGDYVALTHHLFTEAGKRIGRDQARCMLMFRDELYCEANLIIAGRGELIFEGFADDLVPVVGGTGEFKKARGQGRVIPVPNGAKFVFTLFL